MYSIYLNTPSNFKYIMSLTNEVSLDFINFMIILYADALSRV